MRKEGWAVSLLAALAAALPLVLHGGPSCGHDFDFHLQSWLAVADGWRHGLAAPHWVPGANFNAGEPRFVFYPPLSWLLGAFLGLLLPWAAVPVVFTGVCAAGAAAAMHSVASRYCASPNAALAACLYAMSPYLLFTGFERAAYGELLAAVWVPLLLGALLGQRWLSTAVWLALLWYTNAPAGVMGCYLVVLSLGWQLILKDRRSTTLLRYGGALLLGCFLAADYLLPAWYGQRFVAIQAAVGEDMRVEDSFLFAHTGGAFHLAVLHTASWIGVWTLGLGLAAEVWLLWRGWEGFQGRFGNRRAAPLGERQKKMTGHPEPILSSIFLTLLLLVVFIMQFPLSAPVWDALPQLAFLQFPWRLLLVASAVTALLVARITPRGAWAYAAALVFAAGLAGWAGLTRYQPCDEEDRVSAQLVLKDGFPGTDEYAAKGSDNGEIQTGLPPVRLLPSPDADLGDDSAQPNPAWQAGAELPGRVASGRVEVQDWSAEHKLVRVSTQKPGYAVLRLERNQAWRITVDGHPCGPRCVTRDDGLIAVKLDRPSTLEVRWTTTLDVWWGRALSGCAALVLVAGFLLRRRTHAMMGRHEPSPRP